MDLRWILPALALGLGAPALAKPPEGYAAKPGALCGGYPDAGFRLAKGLCAGVVVSPPPAGLYPSKRQMHLPRKLLALPNGDFLVTDLGAWYAGKGEVWRLSPVPGGAPKLTALLTDLDMPHDVKFGPDGRIYVGEMSRIFRFDPNAADPAASVETVVAGLPSNKLHPDRHPLTSFIFDGDGALLVNVGAGTDQCADPAPTSGAVCDERNGDRPHAAIWRFAYQGGGRWSATPTVFARGLRNSVGLVRHPSGAIYQAENGIDLPSPGEPYDALNHVVAGADYGWPYCIDMAKAAPAWPWQGPFCAHVTPPVSLLPPHGAPLDVIYYQGPMFPQLAGRMLVTLHGYRSTGSRILAIAVDAVGAPKTSSKAVFEAYPRKVGMSPLTRYRGPGPIAVDLTPGWDAVKGAHPAGSPVGLAIAADGAIWVAEDRNGAILRIARAGS